MAKLKGVEPKSIDIPDGLHKGKIIKVEERKVQNKYWYQDLVIELDDVKKDNGESLQMKVGYSIGEVLEVNQIMTTPNRPKCGDEKPRVLTYSQSQVVHLF